MIDLATDQAPLNHEAEILIVGGGTVGLLLASMLGRRNICVVVAESGGRGFEPQAQQLNVASQTGKPHDGISNGRARVLGGTSTLWGGQLARFIQSDFEKRPGISNQEWPLRYEDLGPYYEQVASYLGLKASLADDQTVIRRLWPKDQPETGEFELFFTRWLSEPNFARLFFDELRDSPNVTLLLHTVVCGLECDIDGKRMRTSRVLTTKGKSVHIDADRIVVANGTIEASRLMLASAKTCRDVPWAKSAWVGVGFQDHLDLRAARINILDRAKFSDLFQNVVLEGQKLQPKFRLKSHVVALQKSTNVACSVVFESSVNEHLQYLKVLIKSFRNGFNLTSLRDFPNHVAGLSKIWIPLIVRYFKNQRIYSPMDKGAYLNVHCEQVPKLESRIQLDPEARDKYDMPLVSLNWVIDGRRELTSMKAFCIEFDRQLSATGIANLDIDRDLLDENLVVLDRARDSYHQCGGLRMAKSANDGVVSPEARVFGTDNLYVAGAAIFPSSSYANPTFTAMALAARLADQLAMGQS